MGAFATCAVRVGICRKVNIDEVCNNPLFQKHRLQNVFALLHFLKGQAPAGPVPAPRSSSRGSQPGGFACCFDWGTGKKISEAQPEQKRDTDDSHCNTGQQVKQGIDDIDLFSGLTAVEWFQHNKLRGVFLMW